ncbi:MAG: hypothetical protein ACLU4J_25535 [Butyricimonas paravirosa]
MRYLIIIFLSATLIFGCDYLDMVPEKILKRWKRFLNNGRMLIWLRGLWFDVQMIANLSMYPISSR